MPNEPSKNQLFPCLLTSACLFPLFSYIMSLALGGREGHIMICFAQLIGSLTAIFTLFFWWWGKDGPRLAFWFWLLMAISPLTMSASLFFSWLMPGIIILLLSALVHFLFPAIHIVTEARKRKSLWRNVLVCIYIFSLAIGCTILFLGRRYLFEFFPLAALTGILLECSFLKKKKNAANPE